MRRASSAWLAIALALTACGSASPAVTATPAPARGRADASPARLAPEPADRVAERVDAIPDAPATEPALPPDRRFYGGRGLRHRLIHFTFDDGPRAATTPRLLDHLARHRVRATFFLVTRALDDPRRRDTARATVRRMAAEGHTIGLHGHDHRGFRNLSDRDLREQLRYGGQLIADVTARAPHFVRPPYGGRDARTDRVLARLGLRQVLWSMTPERPRNDGQEAIVSQFRAQLAAREGEPFPGTVVLMHDTRPWVVEAIPRILRHLRRRNCQILREGGQLWDVVPTLEALYGLSDAEVAGRQDALRGELAPRCAAATGDEDDTEP